MKSRNKWLLAVLLVMSLFLWACGGGDPAPAAEEPAQQEAGEAPAGAPAENAVETPEEAGEEIDEAQLYALFSAGQTLDELYYEMVMSGFEMENIQSRIWLKGERMRSESEMMGQQFITIYDTEAVYTLDPVEKTALKMPMDMGMGMDESMDPVTAEELTGDIEQESIQYLGTEEVNGFLCHVIQAVETDTGYGTKMWIHVDYGFPMRVESLSTDPEERYVMEVTDFRVGSVSDDQFRIPADYEIIDFSEMFQNMPGMPVVPGS